jgi:hypothetical protein
MHKYVCMYNQLERCGKIMYVQQRHVQVKHENSNNITEPLERLYVHYFTAPL